MSISYISYFIASLEKDTRFRNQIVKHAYMASVESHYNELVLSRGLNDVLKQSGMERYYTHQVEVIRFIRQGAKDLLKTWLS